MSRTFSKILVICAMITILPLLVAGTALAAYNSISNTVKVEIVVNNDLTKEEKDEYQASENRKEIYAKIREQEGEEKDVLTISKAHNKKATVEAFYTDNAFTFIGWFKGDAQAYKNKLTSGITKDDYIETNPSLSFEMSDSNNYVAVYERNTFNVTYSYKAQPDAAAETTEPAGKTTFKFGEKLPVLTIKDSLKNEYKFAGWEVNKNRYTFADFEKSEQGYVLTNPWVSADTVTVTFKVDGKTYTNDYVTGTRLTKKDIEEALENKKVDLNALLTPGYNFEWYLGENLLVNGEFEVGDTPVTIEARKTLIEYKATLSAKAGELAAGVTPAEVKFTAESLTEFNTWFELQTKYGFDRIIGVKYNEVVYAPTANGNIKALTDFRKTYLAANEHAVPTTPAAFELVIQSIDTLIYKFNDVLYVGEISSTADPDSRDIYEAEGSTGTKYAFSESALDGRSTDDTIQSLLSANHGTTGYYFEKERITKVKLAGISIITEQGAPAWFRFDDNFNLNSTIKDLLQKLYTENSNIFGETDIDGSLKFEINTICAVFCPDDAE